MLVSSCIIHHQLMITTPNYHLLLHAHTEQCGRKISANDTGGRGNIESPNHPSYYPSHLDCMWKIGAPAGYALRVNFQILDIESSTNCVYDYLEVTNLNSEGEMVR